MRRADLQGAILAGELLSTFLEVLHSLCLLLGSLRPALQCLAALLGLPAHRRVTGSVLGAAGCVASPARLVEGPRCWPGACWRNDTAMVAPDDALHRQVACRHLGCIAWPGQPALACMYLRLLGPPAACWAARLSASCSALTVCSSRASLELRALRSSWPARSTGAELSAAGGQAMGSATWPPNVGRERRPTAG